MLDAPVLWTVLPGPHPKHTAVMLERAKSAPLRVFVPQDGYLRDDMPSLLARMAQIRELQILPSDMGAARLSWMQSWLAHDAPLMRSLEVSNVKSFSQAYHSPAAGSVTPYEVPATLFNGNAPHLRHLVLRSCTIPLPCSVLRPLRSLHLVRSRDYRGYGGAFNVHHILAGLAEMQDLEELKLLWMLDSESAEVMNQRSDIIQMPRLHRLDVHEHALALLTLASWLHAPALGELDLCMDGVKDGDAILDSLVKTPVFSSYISRMKSRRLLKFVAIQNTPEHLFELKASKGFYHRRDTSEYPLHIDLYGKGVINLRPSVVMILENLGFERLQVDLRDDTGQSAPTWLDILAEAEPTLRQVEVSTTMACAGFVAALSHGDHPISSDMTSAPVLLPALSRIQLSDANMAYTDMAWGGSSLLDLLRNALQARKAKGLKPPMLFFDKCDDSVFGSSEAFQDTGLAEEVFAVFPEPSNIDRRKEYERRIWARYHKDKSSEPQRPTRLTPDQERRWRSR
jgi:hypothetical protein